MEHIRLYSDKLETLNIGNRFHLVGKKKAKGIHSELHAMAKEASDYFNEPKLFGRYIGWIKHIGIQEARKRLAEQKESGVRNPAFFFKKLK